MCASKRSTFLAIALSQTPRDYLFFFRKELVQTLNWAGDPKKSYETGSMGDRLTPRKSFAIWKETVQQQAQLWTISTSTNQLGYFAAGYPSNAISTGGKSNQQILPIVVAALIVAVLLAGVPLTLLRRRQARSGARDEEDEDDDE